MSIEGLPQSMTPGRLEQFGFDAPDEALEIVSAPGVPDRLARWPGLMAHLGTVQLCKDAEKHIKRV